MVRMKPAGKVVLLLAIGSILGSIYVLVLPANKRNLDFHVPGISALKHRYARPIDGTPGSKTNPIVVAVPPSAGVLGLLAANGGADTAEGSIYDADCALRIRMMVESSPESRAKCLNGKTAQYYVTDLATFTKDLPGLRARGIDPVVVYLAAWSRGAHVLLTRPDISRVGSLAGVVRMSPSYFFLRMALGEAWSTIAGKLKLYDTSQEAARDYIAGKLDAVALEDPYVGLVEAQRKSRQLISTKDDPNSVALVLVGDRKWLEANPDAATGVIRGWLKASDGVARGRLEAERLMGDAFALTGKEGEIALKHWAIADATDNRRFFGLKGEQSQITQILTAISHALRQELATGDALSPAQLSDPRWFQTASSGYL